MDINVGTDMGTDIDTDVGRGDTDLGKVLVG